MNVAARASKVRLEIRREQERLGTLLEGLQGRGAMLPGSVYARKRRCGKARCRCVRGHLHEDRVLAVRQGGRMTVRSLASVHEVTLEQAVHRWHCFRLRRRELAAVCRRLMRAVDRLGRLRQGMEAGS